LFVFTGCTDFGVTLSFIGVDFATPETDLGMALSYAFCTDCTDFGVALNLPLLSDDDNGFTSCTTFGLVFDMLAPLN
jgi:2-methylisocitrate lyase-like PEP mutase family enzyme